MPIPVTCPKTESTLLAKSEMLSLHLPFQLSTHAIGVIGVPCANMKRRFGASDEIFLI